eukprot:CAMPEP_0202865308 /NCGR_PEP_ID=MMETSP1391-20130828/5631_1 /ASSEMBLY_ACC=CAM_ASM_000867 /TAXON_ID=1034604 /ORGANISM="Chlamydomonas leiostraca, Strain SAG 11-49" /LENGTH=54 /DNA_ID=CAMNT_0049545133 /DNA_START=15 /DNA_END=179 /DNA_ORIENTATION=+
MTGDELTSALSLVCSASFALDSSDSMVDLSSPDACISSTMSHPPTSSPATYSCG